jgi:hypothetical protein
MCFEVGRIDRDGLIVGCFCRQPHHDPCKHPHIAPPLPAIVEGLVRTILTRCVAPAQAVAIDKDNAAQDTPVIDARPAMALRQIRPQPLHLSLAQPIQTAHQASLRSESVNHAVITASNRLMGPEPKAAFFDECRFHMRIIVQRALCSFGIEPKGANDRSG